MMEDIFDSMPVEKSADQKVSESGFWSLWKSNISSLVHFQRIETGSTGLGIPDVNLCYRGAEVWVELKVTKGWTCDLRPEQIAWHHRRTKADGKTFILTRRKNKGPRIGDIDQIYLHHGGQAIELGEHGLKVEPVLLLERPFNWDKLHDTLFTTT